MTCVPFFFYSDSWIKKYGLNEILNLCLISYSLRLFIWFGVHALSVKGGTSNIGEEGDINPIHNIWFSVLVGNQVFHGINFALFWSCSVQIVSGIVPIEKLNGGMCLLNVSYFTLGGLIGNFIFGKIYDVSGFGCVCFIGCIISLLLFLCRRYNLFSGGFGNFENDSIRKEKLLKPMIFCRRRWKRKDKV